MSTIKQLQKELADFKETADSRGFDLRLDLASLVMRGMDRKGWTQKDLAEACGMKPSFINRIVHSDSNCTFDVAGRILFALDCKVKLYDCDGDSDRFAATTDSSYSIAAREETDGIEKIERYGETGSQGYYVEGNGVVVRKHAPPREPSTAHSVG